MVENVQNPMNEPRYSGIPTFMRAPLATNLNSLDIALVGVPYDGAVEARSGARQGPRQIRDMSSMMRAIHHVTRINPYKLCRIADVGDVHFKQIFDVVAKDFWSFMVYSGQHRSMLQTDQQFPGIDSKKKDLQKNDDGSITVYFGPKAPAGKESNWVQTLPDKSFNLLYRMYGPLEPWFDKTWKLGDFELIE